MDKITITYYVPRTFEITKKLYRELAKKVIARYEMNPNTDPDDISEEDILNQAELDGLIELPEEFLIM
jgi:hypothetical protein